MKAFEGGVEKAARCGSSPLCILTCMLTFKNELL